MKKFILILLLASCYKADVKPVSKVSVTVTSVGIDSTINELDKPRKKGHEWGPK